MTGSISSLHEKRVADGDCRFPACEPPRQSCGNCTSLRSEVERLRAALKPFANSLGDWAHEMGDTRDLWIVWGTPDRSSFKLGDLRTASRALEGKQD